MELFKYLWNEANLKNKTKKIQTQNVYLYLSFQCVFHMTLPPTK